MLIEKPLCDRKIAEAGGSKQTPPKVSPDLYHPRQGRRFVGTSSHQEPS
jgi:hypothetical protein